LAEYTALLIERGAPEPRVLRAIATIRDRARIVIARPVTQALPDPEDAHVIGTALAGGSPIVTRNVRHYPADLVTALTPEQWKNTFKSTCATRCCAENANNGETAAIRECHER
jgi:hypothetical protein